MSAQILTLLKFGLLALLYLFFVRVLFSVWSELRPTGKHTSGPVSAPSATPEPALIGAPPGVGRGTQVVAPSSVPPAAAQRSTPPVAAPGDPFVPLLGRLLVLEPAGLAGLSYELGDELTVGRAPGCGISLDDTFVSSLHARIYRHEGSYVLEDLDSTNGTFLNGGKVTGPNIMQISDTVRFGSMLLELQ